MKVSTPLFILAAAGVVSSANSSNATTSSNNRPLIHYTPEDGWMNDPNGLWYDAKDDIWHLYFQYNPNDTVWGEPLYWGHSVSDDLTNWNYSGIAIEPARNDSGAFSGSMVIDYNNTSGFYDNSTDPRQRAVAIWTYNTPENQSQYVSYSLDGGYTFIQYGNVLDINSTQFRDPKVIWHDETEKWIMTLAHSQKFEILIYSSSDLKEWDLESSFSHVGYMGYQYECPGLVKVPIVKATNNNDTLSEVPYATSTYSNISETEEAWVMFLSINPGGPLGGSVTQYFIGDFNGTHFVPFTSQTRFADFGKDFYALQTFFNTPNGKDVMGIAWASNWQYGQFVPTDAWRSSMSLVRNFTLQEYAPNGESIELNLNSVPVFDRKQLKSNSTYFNIQNKTLEKDKSISFNLSHGVTGLLDFTLIWSVNGSAYDNHAFADFSIYLKGARNQKEYLRLGYEANAASFFLDRGNSDVTFVKENPYFTDKLSVLNEPYGTSSSGASVYKVYGVVDRNILELYFNDGSSVSTNLFFFSDQNYIGNIEVVSAVDYVFNIEQFTINSLRK